uniref:Retrovirus-related Pol polyprotein from transposon TNT 1-94 n=2 Tax=Tanacetum cinerariifolium TaxID=118510 RepID=A0A6L2LWA7_TANCI|nr:retrovirus-related Pol polyprotein from transposon TNT 1-94 [Tanacetum cinerariifolium]
MLMYISLYGFELGRAQTGISGTGIGYIPQPGSGSGGNGGGFGNGGFGNGGGGGGGFGGISSGGISKALVCLNDKIYSNCEESYRLTQSGNLNVPPDYTDQFCGGACLKETDLVLNCISDVLSNFLFYNRATVRDVKDTIKAGCSFGPNRGDFNIADHIQSYGSNSFKFSYPILIGIDNDIYSTVDACPNACEMWKAIERLKQGESLESYYSRFYKMMNELVRNQCDVTNHQVNVQFLLQLQPKRQRFVTLVKHNQELKTISYHKLYDILKQHQNEVNEIRAERLARTDNPLALVAQQQPDDTDDESDDQKLEARYMYKARIQEFTPDIADNYGLIFDTEPLQQVQNDDDNYNVFGDDQENPKQPASINDPYPDMCYDREHDDQDDTDELVQERDLLASLIEKLKCKIDDSKNRNKFLETSNQTLVDKLKDLKKFQVKLDRYHDVNYASKVAIDCAKAKGDLMSYKMESEKSFNEYTRKINVLNQKISNMKKELFAHQETISIMSQQKEARIKYYKTREDKEIDKVIALENKVKLVDIILFIVDSGCSKHMTGNLKLLTYFVEKFIGTVKFRNDQIASILGYEDLSTCYIRDLKGNDILTGLHAQIRTIRTEKGTEFLNKTLHAYFAKECIRRETSTARTPKQNDVVERRDRTLVEATRTMLSTAKVSLFFWAEAIATACFSQNRSLVIPRHEKTPYHIINGRKPCVKFFHIFGSLCYIVRDGENLDKMKEKGDACIFVGYSTLSRAYRVFNKRTRIIIETIHVNFDEFPHMASDHVTETVTTSNELDFLFSLMFDELLNETTPVVSKSSVVNAADAPNQFQQKHTTPSTSTTVAKDTPSLNIQTTPKTTFEDNEFINIFCTPVQEQGETPSRYVDSSNMNTFHQRRPSEHRWTKDHPLEQDIGNPSQSIRTRRQLEADGEMCMFAFTVSRTKSKNIKEAMADFAWIESMLEELHQFDRLDIHQSPRGIFINQAKYAQEILKKHGMTSCDSVGTSMATKHLDVDLSGTPVDQTKYHSMVRALMYLTASRPDIVHATCYCARYQAKPTEKHLTAVEQIFWYLKATINIRLWYSKDTGFKLKAFSDLDHAGCLDSCKSTSGGIQFLGGDKLVSWSSKKQDCTSMSLAGAEYVSLSACCAQVLWLRTQLTDYGFYFDKIPMYCDSKATIAISCNPVQHSRTKHIDVGYHFIKEKVENGIVELFFVGTEYQLADLFTKVLSEYRFKHLVRRLGMRCLTLEELEVLANKSA